MDAKGFWLTILIIALAGVVAHLFGLSFTNLLLILVVLSLGDIATYLKKILEKG